MSQSQQAKWLNNEIAETEKYLDDLKKLSRSIIYGNVNHTIKFADDDRPDLATLKND